MKPIRIAKVQGGYNLFVNDIPVVADGKNVNLDRAKVGLKVPADYANRAPKNTEPKLIAKASDAASIAHQIGRYMLNLGDMTFSYTELVGIGGNHDAWWSKAK
jgi:hypothetical protein